MKEVKRRLTFAVALIGDGNGATCAAGGKSQVAGTLVGVSVGPANGACGGSLLRGRLGAPASAPHAVRAQILVQQAAPALAAPDPCARTCSTLYTLLRTVLNRPRDRCVAFPSLVLFSRVVSPRTREPTARARAHDHWPPRAFCFLRSRDSPVFPESVGADVEDGMRIDEDNK